MHEARYWLWICVGGRNRLGVWVWAGKQIHTAENDLFCLAAIHIESILATCLRVVIASYQQLAPI